MTKPPEGYATRAPSPEDAEEVVALMVACQLEDTGEADMSLDELIDDWHGLDLAEEAVVVAAPDGRIAVYADVLNRSYVTVSVYGYVHPDYRGRGVGASLVDWGERWTREHMPLAPEDARVVVQHYINAANEGARRLLEGSGYAPVRGVYVMETELDEEIPAPHWPAGISVDTFVPGRDERATHEAVEDAFKDLWGRPRNTFESFLQETEKESFDPSLWFLARSGGEISGVALCKVLEGQGWVTCSTLRRPAADGHLEHWSKQDPVCPTRLTHPSIRRINPAVRGVVAALQRTVSERLSLPRASSDSCCGSPGRRVTWRGA